MKRKFLTIILAVVIGFSIAGLASQNFGFCAPTLLFSIFGFVVNVFVDGDESDM